MTEKPKEVLEENGISSPSWVKKRGIEVTVC
jgi:hypothetical protein